MADSESKSALYFLVVKPVRFMGNLFPDLRVSSVALIRPKSDGLRSDFLVFWLNHPDTYRSVIESQTGCAIQ
ncbi:MAG: hypothetical protein JNG88_04910 [Phycisphaerales bacterium]|nr:hypothetical protein [Phycisphaerales bacterium]